MSTNILQNNKNKILYFLIIVSIASFVNTVSKGLVNGCDFQWQPAVLLWEGINHYEKFIINGKGDFLCQMVNMHISFMSCYIHLLYLVGK